MMTLFLTQKRTDSEQMKLDMRKNFPRASDLGSEGLATADIHPMLLTEDTKVFTGC